MRDKNSPTEPNASGEVRDPRDPSGLTEGAVPNPARLDSSANSASSSSSVSSSETSEDVTTSKPASGIQRLDDVPVPEAKRDLDDADLVSIDDEPMDAFDALNAVDALSEEGSARNDATGVISRQASSAGSVSAGSVASMSAGDTTSGLSLAGRKQTTRSSTPTVSNAQPLPADKQRENSWFLLLVILGIAMLPLLLEIHRLDVLSEAEGEVVATQMATWHHRQALQAPTHSSASTPVSNTEDADLESADEQAGGASVAWWSTEMLMPQRLGEARPDMPPGGVWIHQLMLDLTLRSSQTDLHADNRLAGPGAEQFIRRARYVAVFGAILTLGGLFWMGYGIGQLKPAAFAAVVVMACPLFLVMGRVANDATLISGFLALAMAAAVWAMRPLRPAAGVTRQLLGWLMCGLFTGMLMLVAGVTMVAWLLVPLLAIIALCPRRWSHLFGLIAAIAIAALMILPWSLAIYMRSEAIGESMASSVGLWPDWFVTWLPLGFAAEASEANEIASAGGFWDWLRALGWSVGWCLLAVVPWSLWLVASWVQPFSLSSVGSRQRMLIGWLWFVLSFGLLIMTPVSGWSSGLFLLMVIPAGLLIGQVMRQCSDLSAEARHTRFWLLLRWPFVHVLGLVAIVLPLGGAYQDWLIERNILNEPIVAAMPWFYWFGASVALLIATGLSARFAARHHPGRTVLIAAGWTVILTVMIVVPLARGPLADTAMKHDARRVLSLVQPNDMFLVLNGQSFENVNGASATISMRFLAHAGLPLKQVSMNQLETLSGQQMSLALLVSDELLDSPENLLNDQLEASGLKQVGRYAMSGVTLYRSAENGESKSASESAGGL